MKNEVSLISKVLMISLCALIQSCSDDSNETKISKPMAQNLVKDDSKKLKSTVAIKEHWLLDANAKVKPKQNSLDRPLDDQEISLLEADRKEMEDEVHILIQEMDDNLDNPEVRKEISEKLQQTTLTNNYKQKMLLLAKDKLKKQ